MNITKIVRRLGDKASKNSPAILTGMAVFGLIMTVIFTAKGTSKAVKLIKEEKDERGETELTIMETVKISWKCYIPATGFCIGTMVCIIGSNRISAKRYAALAGLYGITLRDFTKYKEKITETLGKGKEAKIRDEIEVDKTKEDPPNGMTIINTGRGKQLCRDSLGGFWFYHDIEKMRKAINDLNDNLILTREEFVTLNDLYYELGLPNIGLGEFCGWDRIITPRFTWDAGDDNKPYVIMSFQVVPKFI